MGVVAAITFETMKTIMLPNFIVLPASLDSKVGVNPV